MEELVNSNIFVDIELIDNISGANQQYEISFTTKEKEKYKLVFGYVWDIRCSIENGYIDRFYKFVRKVERESSVLLVNNSETIKYFEHQLSGTLPTDELKNYIMYDSVDSVIEILSLDEPTLSKV